MNSSQVIHRWCHPRCHSYNVWEMLSPSDGQTINGVASPTLISIVNFWGYHNVTTTLASDSNPRKLFSTSRESTTSVNSKGIVAPCVLINELILGKRMGWPPIRSMNMKYPGRCRFPEEDEINQCNKWLPLDFVPIWVVLEKLRENPNDHTSTRAKEPTKSGLVTTPTKSSGLRKLVWGNLKSHHLCLLVTFSLKYSVLICFSGFITITL